MSALFAPDSPRVLVADIGGTNARFALAGRDAHGAIAIAGRHDLQADDYVGLGDCLEAYLATLAADDRPHAAAFGVASPVAGDRITLTNRAWSFGIAEFKARFGWDRFEVVNDFAALGHAAPALKPGDWRSLVGPPWPEQLPPVVSLVGPGTGFGVGAVARGDGGYVVVPSEGGHAGFAPFDALEAEILKVMLRRFPRVSNERVLSGPGLENLHAALAEIRGAPASRLAAPAILEAALGGADSLAAETVERFCLMLGGVMGDIALVQGAGAVALAGGIAPRLIEVLDTPAVRERFEAKGRAREVMAGIPIALIVHPEPALLGAARLIFTN